ncbi:MAG: hypothetical protein OXH20_01595 [bacterium]|nr:hypothetical protein [bacterium]MDE0668016.1 hypothetical protein [bacterium]MXZ29914.1 hypothetical protein [Acidimicrobiia bacterium]MYB24350.1 hypothetical protein [Acidimicrobiia bacterium]MYJ14845.1 hypothetical protein [Acidimicrobiia bacterium]
MVVSVPSWQQFDAVLPLLAHASVLVHHQRFADEGDMIRYVAHLATTHGQTGRRFDQSSPLLLGGLGALLPPFMAATTGGPVASPLLDLSARIGDVVELHNRKTESVVQLWTQTIALLSLAGGIVALMYRNNPGYFEPSRAGAGQLVLVGIAGLLLIATGFLVRHSVVRDERSVLAPPTRRGAMKGPL